MPLFNAKHPGNSQYMFGVLMTVAAFDAIPTDWVYDNYIFGPKEGDPINPDFEAVGFETIWIVPNLGSLGWYIAFVPLIYLFYFALYFCRKHKKINQQRARLRKSLFWNILIRTTIESYTIIIVCCFIGLEHIDMSGDFYVKLNTWFTIVLTFYTLVFPFWGYILMKKYANCLEEKEDKFGELWADTRSNRHGKLSKSVQRFVLFTYLRRIILAISVVVLRDNFTF